MKQFFLGLLVNLLLFANFGFVFAQDFDGVIPRVSTDTEKYPYDCHSAYPQEIVVDGEVVGFTFFTGPLSPPKNYMLGQRTAIAQETVDRLKQVSIGTKIKGGCVGLADIPIIIIKLIDLCTKLAGTIAVIFGLYAGYQMITSGITEDRESAKNTLKYAAIGLVVTLTAWIIVNVIQVQLTS